MSTSMIAAAVAAVLCLLASPGQAQLKDENLLVPPPAGFKATNNGVSY